jgi:hypothetical protein
MAPLGSPAFQRFAHSASYVRDCRRRELARRRFANLPKILESDEEDEEAEVSTTCSESSDDDRQKNALTTLMIRNIPHQYTPQMLLEEWPSMGAFDVLYLPQRKSSQSVQAFVNFTSEDAAVRFRAFWEGRHLARFVKSKPLSVNFAEMQGRKTYFELFHKKCQSMKHNECPPMLFETSKGCLENMFVR